MALYEISTSAIVPLAKTTFSAESLRERGDLQRLLRDKIDVVCPDTMVLSEEFGDWEESKRRIDLLGLDKKRRLVVIELKRTEDGGHMELQAIRYAAMVSSMSFAQAVTAHQRWMDHRGIEGDARTLILNFLEWDESEETEPTLAGPVQIALVSADFSREVTTTVLWLSNEYDVDVACVRLQAYRLDSRIIVDVQRIIPLPEAEEYMERVREKERAERESQVTTRDRTRFDVTVGGVLHERQPKNRTLFLLVRELCRAGVAPDDVAAVVEGKTIWKACDGIQDHNGFVRQLANSVFDPSRWFCDDDELIHFDGRTYAFASTWGGAHTIQLIFDIARKWSDKGVSVEKHEPLDREAA